jgi:hypothetical protein
LALLVPGNKNAVPDIGLVSVGLSKSEFREIEIKIMNYGIFPVAKPGLQIFFRHLV